MASTDGTGRDGMGQEGTGRDGTGPPLRKLPPPPPGSTQAPRLPGSGSEPPGGPPRPSPSSPPRRAPGPAPSLPLSPLLPGLRGKGKPGGSA